MPLDVSVSSSQTMAPLILRYNPYRTALLTTPLLDAVTELVKHNFQFEVPSSLKLRKQNESALRKALVALVALIQEFDKGKAIENHLARDEPSTEQFELTDKSGLQKGMICAQHLMRQYLKNCRRELILQSHRVFQYKQLTRT